MDKKKLGEVTEHRIQLWFLENDIPVLCPIGDSERYDFVVDYEGEFIRVQSKTGWYYDGVIKFNARSTTSNTNEVKEKQYNSDEIDGFAVYSEYSDDIYWVPVSDVSGSRFSIRVDDVESNQPTINWAEEYHIAERFK